VPGEVEVGALVLGECFEVVGGEEGVEDGAVELVDGLPGECAGFDVAGAEAVAESPFVGEGGDG
jgi:hypothetical protein